MTNADEPVSVVIGALLDGCTSRFQMLAEQEEGPYRRGAQPRRRDVSDGCDGSPFSFGLRLHEPGADAVVGVDVDIWHCDPEGRYSGYPPNNTAITVDPAPQPARYLPGETFLRGRQTTDAAGDIEFHTIYPGWYPGRTVHIHLMVHMPDRSYTSQLYFPESVTSEVFAHGPYRDHGLPDTTHASDGIFPTGGDPAVFEIHADARGRVGVLCLVLPGHEAP